MNQKLFNQLKAEIQKDFEDLQLLEEGVLKYFVRNGEVQQVIGRYDIELVNNKMTLKECESGLSGETLELFFTMLQDHMSNMPYFDYGYLHIMYKVSANGKGFDSLRFCPEKRRHIPRM